ncbi:SpaA isopeptide-forming pilin-related protein [Blautia massiliensis (ex Durand et al. 2017)]|uniref:SpaA isopeptide-forming pilin-related protein n=1 Tax=Blautia massiliensis (ex Durand et al. 2017) TaxID=1737424 RepID=UPI00156EA80F|nr:SpaA isopeptide-forming pilin-related protein [Blautia massiliensis (ex Durand et al. 2017)]NSG50206.1 VWA domain-containing protein [Blautia massiliensis (ex Durand et al. 2017)]NSL01927.1 VWA domain-containing protein [Blautia massiliensis (ex Durand et al. 2017)]
MKKLRNNKIRKLLAFMVALALMVSCMPSAYTISASEAFGDGTEDIFTDGEITSEPAAEESTPDVSSADQEETEQAQQSTLTYENDSVKVTAEALEDGALPQNTALKADSVNENSFVSYDTVSQKLSAAATDKGSSLRGFFAYDVYFADGDGNRVEPNGRVRVTFEYKTPAAPELTDAASTSVTVEKLHYNSSTGDTDVNTLQANEDLKVLNVNEGKQIQTLQVETGNTAVFAVMWDSPETADVEAEAVSGNEDEVSIASEELTDGMDISDEPEQDAAETPAAENPEVTPEAEPSEEPAENPDAEPTEAPAEDPDVVEEPAEDIASPEDVPAADENGETSLIEVLGDDTNLRVSPSIEAEVLATVNAGTQLTLLDTVTAEDGATWYKVSWEGTEAYIRSDMAQVVDSSDEAEEPEDVQEEEIQPEITRYDYTSDEVNVKVTLTDPADLPDNAELSVTPVELSQEAEDQITEEAIKEKKAIEKIHSYDIKFLVDGEEVQPGASVKVSVSLNDEKKIKDADVYHVDENDNVENMDGSVAKNGDVEFETTHFSTYVIVNKKNDGTINVTVEHYDNATQNKIYADDEWKNLAVGEQVNCKKAVNWDIDHVEVITNSGETAPTPDSSGKIYLAQNATVKVYYNPSTGTTVGQPTFYDYTVKAVANDDAKRYGYPSINQNDSYSSDSSISSNKILMGAYTHQYSGKYQYNWKKDGKIVNDWTGTPKQGEQPTVITGLLKGVNSDKTVKFNYQDPGLFVNSDKTVTIENETRYLRQVYRNYELGFARSGDSYSLKEVKDGNGNVVTGQYNSETGNDFFPLDSVKKPYENSYKRKSDSIKGADTTEHNYYFGMRYEIKFQLKDYIGDLNYSFKGDDDMWVVLDGGKTEENGTVDYGNVIIDLGGIHDAASANVDLWEKLFGKEYANGASDKDAKRASLTEAQKKEEHTLTVLYLERGAGLSNCKMNFTLPNAEVSSVTTTDLAKLTFTKVKKDGGTPLPGAVFKLYTDDTCTTELKTATSEADGTVTFDKLFPGTYYMKEVQAPNGYVASNEVWTVDVTEGNETAMLKDSSGNQVTSIVNETPEEIINSSMTTSKTAKVKDWDQRTYDITINATSTSTSSIIETKTPEADIMLVLDVSGSMGDPLYKYNHKGDNTSDGRSDLDTGITYYICVDGSYKEMRYYRYYGWLVYDNGDWFYATDSKYSNCKIYTRSSTETRLDALKNAVNQFIDDTAEKSPKSKIGITVFSSTNYGDHGKFVDLGEVGSKVDNADSAKVKELKTFVNNLNANGGTDPAVGLEDAKNKLDAMGDKNPKYVVLFTDGKPTGGGSDWNSTAQKNAETQASELRTGLRNKTNVKAPYTVYTIGFALNDEGDRAKTFLSGGDYKGKTYPGIASSKDCAKTADDAASLTQIFQSISSTINKNVDITGATITDVIDNRFEIVDRGNVITETNFEDGKYTLENGGIVTKRSDGTYQVQWTDQTIKHTTDGTNGWSRTITVKAKDSFIGGNNIPTNVYPDSKISVGDLEKVLDQPTVNVKVNLVVKDKEITIYKGDSVPMDEQIRNELFATSKPTSYKDGIVSETDSKKEDGTSLIKLQWFKKDNGVRTNIDESEIKTALNDGTEYYLEVTYTAPTESTDTSKTNTDGHFVGTETAKNPGNNNNPYGIYKINVIKGQIQITKNVTEISDTDRTFTFNVNAKNGQNVSNSQVSVTVKANETSGTVTLPDLPRGEYTVTEDNADGYSIQAFNVVTDDGQTDCENFKSNVDKSLKFTLGNDVNKANVITTDYKYTSGGVKGVASYTNEAVISLDLKKTDTDNHSLTGAKFKLEIKADDDKWNTVEENVEVKNGNSDIELNTLKAGIYKLTETTAPKGYSLLGSSIYFKVATGNVTLVDENGDPTQASQASNMWSLENKVLTIKNAKLYSLPESGGPGTYGFTISGVAILATALLLFINNKRREEEATRS